MPLVAHNDLPTFERLRKRGHNILTLEEARRQDSRELHIGLLNMMPDAALTATEQQFMGLVGSSNLSSRLYVYPFSIPELNRDAQTEEHIEKYYFEFENLAEWGLDALIITGANVVTPLLDQEPIWMPLIAVADWAEKHCASTLCSCLASHALIKHSYQVDRRHLPLKQWGVYSHEVVRPEHPLMNGVQTRFDAPHSRWNEVSRSQLEQAGLTILVDSAQVGVHMAVSPDQFRVVYTQGHPEYDANSLLKEYKREVFRFLNGELEAAPPYPENYLSSEAIAVANRYIEEASSASSSSNSLPDFPENEMAAHTTNAWRDTGNAIVSNWLDLIHKLTNLDRRLQYAPGVDPKDPLQLR
jgi:homoserine O-succinyltransferase